MAASPSKAFQKPETVRRERRPLWKHFLRATPITLSTVLLTVLFARVVELDHTAMDLESRWRKPRMAPTTTLSVVIVQITEDDYKDHFAQTSPLNPAKVAEIIDAIADGKPRLIGVDLDTSHQDYATLESGQWPSIVWGQGLVREQGGANPLGSETSSRAGPCDFELNAATPPEQLYPGRVKGMDAVAFQQKSLATGPSARVDIAGLFVMAPDSDGLIRRYQRCWETRAGRLPSFVCAVSKPRRDTDADCAPRKRPRAQPIKYGQFHRWCFSAGHLLEQSQLDRERWLKDKIVLLGGSFLAARDEHPTPLGQKLGVDILAAAIETELSRKDNGSPRRWTGLEIARRSGYTRSDFSTAPF